MDIQGPLRRRASRTGASGSEHPARRARILTGRFAASLLSLAALLAALSPQARAEATPPGATTAPVEDLDAPPIAHGTLYLRLHLGLGYAALSGDPKVSGNPNEKVSGAGASFGAALGGRVTPNVAIFGTLFGVAMPGPDHVYANGSPYTLTAGGLLGMGAGVVRTFEPSNLYVSGALAAMMSGFMNLGDDEPELGRRATRYGVGLQGIVGKDWWTSRSWGFGVAAEVIVARTIEGPTVTAETWTSGAFSLLCSLSHR